LQFALANAGFTENPRFKIKKTRLSGAFFLFFEGKNQAFFSNKMLPKR